MTIPKIGDEVIAIDVGDMPYLTEGKSYTVTSFDEDDPSGFYVIDNDGDEIFFHSYRFRKVVEESFPVNDQGGVKDTVGKLRWTLLPWKALREVVNVLEYGAKKYSADNWKKVEPEKYKEAAFRHWIAYIEGEKLDPETGYSHLAHLTCDILFLLWFEVTGKING